MIELIHSIRKSIAEMIITLCEIFIIPILDTKLGAKRMEFEIVTKLIEKTIDGSIKWRMRYTGSYVCYNPYIVLSKTPITTYGKTISGRPSSKYVIYKDRGKILYTWFPEPDNTVLYHRVAELFDLIEKKDRAEAINDLWIRLND